MAAPTEHKLAPLDLFKELAQLPTFTSATFLGPADPQGRPSPGGDRTSLHVGLSAKLHHRGTKVSLTRDVPLLATGADSRLPPAQLPPQELAKGSTEFFSPDGRFRGTLVTRDDERFVEVWDLTKGSLKAAKKVTKEVGEFLADEQWGPPTFSPHSDRLLFVAHALDNHQPDEPRSVLETHRFTPTWGELQRTLTSAQIYVFDFSVSSAATVLPLLNAQAQQAGVSFGQGQFARDTGGVEGVICAAFGSMEDGRKLGVVYCTNRRSSLWFFPLGSPQDGWRFTPESRSARSPRVLARSTGADTVVWLSNPLGGPHNSCATLHGARIDSAARSDADVLVDVVWEPKSETAFPGLYLNTLPAQPFLAPPDTDQRFVALSSIFRSSSQLLIVPLPSASEAVSPRVPVDLATPKSASLTVLGTDGKGRLAIVTSSLLEPASLSVRTFDGKALTSAGWSIGAALSSEAKAAVSRLEHRLDRLPEASHVETLSLHLRQSTAAAKRKLLLSPHGGPHSTTTNAFSPSLAALALAGFEVASVNYTGSLGFGQRWVAELVGRCGERDVADCWAVVEAWRAGLQPGQTGKVYVQGGSHGGFLTAHLTSRYPDAFTAAVLRNPVVSLGENLCVTDIPDWVFNELGIAYPLESAAHRPLVTPTAEQYAFLQSRSPISHVDAVSAHTLVLMGTDDRRVPPAQSKAWYHSLQGKSARAARTAGARALDVACLAFAGEGHALDGVAAELAAFEATLEWLGRY